MPPETLPGTQITVIGILTCRVQAHIHRISVIACFRQPSRRPPRDAQRRLRACGLACSYCGARPPCSRPARAGRGFRRSRPSGSWCLRPGLLPPPLDAAEHSRPACARGTDPDLPILRFVPSLFARQAATGLMCRDRSSASGMSLSSPGDGGSAVGVLDPRALSAPGGRHRSMEEAHALSLGASASIAVVVLSSRKPPDWCCHSLA